MMRTLMELYQKPMPSKDTLRVWWEKLAHFEFNQVSKAFDDYSDNNDRVPSPSQIIELCQAQRRYVELPKLPRPQASPEVIKENLEKINKMAELKPKTDYKKWARDILANPKAYPDISVRFAKDALGVDYENT